VRAILLTGGVGAGKTTVLQALGELLEERGEPYALVDLDWLCWARPRTGTPHELLCVNLASVAAAYAEHGVERLVLARHLASAAELDAVRAALPGVDLTAVRLVADAGTRATRLRARDSGAELEEHLALLRAGEVPQFEDAEVTSEADPAEVAGAVLDAAGWYTR
jgi:energy-coupling factor transporter ATP-binding protein EcfA2